MSIAHPFSRKILVNLHKRPSPALAMPSNETGVEHAWKLGTEPEPLSERLNAPLDAHPPSFGPRPAFLESSQARHWMFRPSTLTSMRSDTHTRACNAISSYSSSAGDALRPTILSMEDEVAIVQFYLLRIGKIVKALGLPSLVEATAMTMMKRFYLRNSCMQFHPKLIMLV